ncbi:MAG: helix-turn-helix transcriptional regulator [Acutalibacteraceae bacterium]|nr:helix-turn-helix transcriptional regulator [Acutalibacteraceae bacterium]
MTIGERLKFLRKNHLKMTQSEFGDRIGVKGNTVTNYESGNRSMSDQTIKSICREFGVNKDWLLEGKEPMMFEVDDIDKLIGKLLTNENETAYQLFKALAKLDEEDWKAVQKLIDELKNT